MRRIQRRILVLCGVLLGLAASRALASPVPFVYEGEILATDAAADGDWFGWSLDVDGDGAVVTSPYRTRTGDGLYFLERDSMGAWSVEAIVPRPPTNLTFYGNVVAIEGNIAVFGARFDSDLGSFAGAVFVYERVGGVWSAAGKITASDGAALDNFGEYVALSGGRLFVAAKGADEGGMDMGAVYVFERVDGVFQETAKLRTSDVTPGAYFGVPLAADGDTLLVGAPRDEVMGEEVGAAFVFERVGGAWTSQGKLRPGGTFRGASNIAVSGDVAVLSQMNGAAIFERSGGVWTQSADVTDGTGGAVAAFDEDVFVGSVRGGASGEILQYTRIAGTWTLADRLARPSGETTDSFSNTLATDGITLLAGALGVDTRANNAGAAYVFALERLALGQSCDSERACLSGECIDGVCCDTACGAGAMDDCLACNNPGSIGVCSSVMAGAACGDPSSGICDEADTCDAMGACQTNHAADGSVCEAGSYCTGGDACHDGMCEEGAKEVCEPGLVCVEDLDMCISTCGNGAVDVNEECDDGDANSDDTPDACRSDCRSPRCGDGVVDMGEACDDDSAACTECMMVPGVDAGVVDAGAGNRDAGVIDAGTMDSGAADGGGVDSSTVDAGAPIPPGDGCGCGVAPTRHPARWTLLFALALLCRRRRLAD